MPNQSAPTIETKNLILRAHKNEDFISLKEMWAHPKVVEHISGIPSTEQQSWMRFFTYNGMWKVLGYGYWAVEEKSSGRFVGDVGFADFKREITPSIAGIPEGGWVLHPDFHGKGYASEALKAMIEWGDINLPGNKSVCIINPENIASIKLAEKCGYKKVVETTFMDKPTVMFERIKS